MVTSARAAVTLLLSCSFGCLTAQMAFPNVSADNEVRSSFIQRRLRSQERREMQREILSILGLPHRPRPQVHTKHTAAPMFMMDLYNSISEEPESPGFSYYSPLYPSSLLTPQDNRFLDDADTVMSFSNLSKLQLNFQKSKNCVCARRLTRRAPVSHPDLPVFLEVSVGV